MRTASNLSHTQCNFLLHKIKVKTTSRAILNSIQPVYNSTDKTRYTDIFNRIHSEFNEDKIVWQKVE
jgi:hypothetical protein